MEYLLSYVTQTERSIHAIVLGIYSDHQLILPFTMIYPSETVYGSLIHNPVKRRKDLATFDELDTLGFAFLSKNHFIRSGYRVHYSAKDCLLSLFQLHRDVERLDPRRWLARLCTLGAPDTVDSIGRRRGRDSNMTDRRMRCVHRALLHAQRDLPLDFDFAGILLLMMGAAVPMLYYTSYCDVFIRNLYVSMAFFFGATGFCVSFTAAFRTSRAFALQSSCPLSWLALSVYMMLGPLLSSLPFNLPDVVFYASRFPERISPGRFDIWGSSHQWWHQCVVIAGILYYQQTLQLHAWRGANPCV
ncbi:Adiponectin receptor protein 2 [Aphanomyces cochlioides]|nr:Adiponectin receptor protein 2 [Aphanomyces cochlioides]